MIIRVSQTSHNWIHCSATKELLDQPSGFDEPDNLADFAAAVSSDKVQEPQVVVESLVAVVQGAACVAKMLRANSARRG